MGANAPVYASKRWGWGLIALGLVGLICSAILSIEKYLLLSDPFYMPTCNVSEAVNCTPIMQSDQAAAFGFPNPYIGLGAFSVVLAIGVGILAGAQFARWFWFGLNIGSVLGLIFVFWLMYQSFFVIGALCPYCMVVWVVTAILTVITTIKSYHEINGIYADREADVEELEAVDA